ncbi:hypothetical protein RB595_005351 [Gaeumannomyces hyphopodioides]
MSSAFDTGQGPARAGAICGQDEDIYGSNDDSYHPLQDNYESRQQQQQHQPDGAAQQHDESALTPSDGYFGMTGVGMGAGSAAPAASSQVPHVPDIWVRDPSLEQDATIDSKAREAGHLSATQRGRGITIDSRQQHGALAAGATADHSLSPQPQPSFARGLSRELDQATLHRPWPDRSSQNFHLHHQDHHQTWSASSSPSAAVATPSWHSTASIAGSALNGSAFLHNPNHQGNHSCHSQQRHRQPASASYPPSDAPPAYSPRRRDNPATTTPPGSPPFRQPSHQPSPAQPRQGYHTFTGTAPVVAAAAAAAAMPGHRQESEGLLAREPESMGGDLEDYIYEQPEPRWRQRLRRRLPFIRSNLCKGIALGLVLLTITSIFLAASVRSLRDGAIDTPAPSVPQESSVLGPPDDPPNPDAPRPKPGPPKPAPTAYPPFDRELTFPDNSRCKDGDFRKSSRYLLAVEAGRTLLVKEATLKDTTEQGAYVHVYGDVVFRKSDDGNAAATVQLRANDESIVANQEFDSSAQSLVVKVPHKIPWDDKDKSPCVQVRITVTVPEGAKLDSLQVTTQTLGVKFLDNLSIGVTKSTLVRTISGQVGAAVNGENDLDELAHHGAPRHFRLDSRYVSIKTTSADIVGSWPLFDLLALETTSGTIKAGVDPKPADEDKPRDAKLLIKSTSGNVEFWEPVHQARRVLLKQQEQSEQANMLAPPPPRPAEELLPPREYMVDVHTTSGSIKGAVAFTYSARIRSTSGTAAVDLLPVLPAGLAVKPTRFASLDTSSTSGATALRVLDPFWVEGDNRYSTAPSPPPPMAPAQPPPPPPRPPIVSPGRITPPLNNPSQDLGDPERGIVVPVGGGGAFNVPPATGPSIIVPSLPSGPVDVSRRRGPPAGAERFLRVLRARHSTTSANIGVRLPGCWEGDIDVSTRSGRIDIEGKGVRVIKKGEDLPGFNRHVVARKGDQDHGNSSPVAITTVSGDSEVAVGGKM